MANEFKIKKGLIVTGASGGTVVDIQGSQGQLFSVTDDLSGSIFAVSDISGVPILDVNSSGLSTFSDNVVIGSVDSVLTGLNIGEVSPTIQLFDTTNDGKLLMYMQDSSAVVGTYSNHSLNLFTDSTLALAIDTSQNATFAGTITGQNIYGNQFVDSQDNAYYANPAATSVMKGATFDGDVTVTTQAIGDDSTLVATTAYADAAAAAVPIGNYLPLSAGSGEVLTGDLAMNNNIGIITKDSTGAFRDILKLNSSNLLEIGSSALASDIIFKNTGNVGIGTTTPTAPLHIEGGTNSEVLKIEADANPYIRWVQNGTNVGFLQFNGGSAYLSNMANGSFFFRTNNTDKMTILSGGNVGIGTTSPENLLHVQQAGLFTGTQTTAGIRVKSSGASAIDNYHGTIALSRGTGSVAISAVQEASDSDVMGMAFFTHPSTTGGDAAVEKMRITSGGELIINGTTSTYGASQGYPLHVKGTDSQGYVSICRGTQNSGSEGLIVGTDSSNAYLLSRDNIPLILGSNNLSHVFIKPSGNVGIGTTSPGFKLDVNSSSFVGARIESTSSGYAPASILLESGHADSRGQGIYQYNSVSKNSWFSGVPYSTTSDDWVIAHKLETTAFNSDVAQMSNALFCVNDNGNVGIGITAPRDALEIAGNIRFTVSEDYFMIKPDGTNQGGAFIVGDGVDAADTPIMSLSGLWGGKVTIQTTVGTSSLADKTAFDIQGTQGQLFSVTDNLSGSIFAVADISGVPIFDVNSSGVSYFDGDVGIGTSSPGAKLHVDGTAIFDTQSGAQPFYITRDGVANQALKIYTDDVASYFTTIQDETTGNYGSMAFILDNGAPSPYYNFGYGSSSLMRIQSNGNVGIGVTTTSYKLEVNGASKISGNVIIGSDPNTYANLTLKDATTTGSSSKSLHIISQNSGRSFLSLITAGTGEAQIGFGTSQYASQNTAGSIQYTTATNNFTFKTNYTLALTIANNQAATFTSTVTATNFILSSDKTLKNNIKEIDTSHIDVNWKNFELKSEPGVKRAGVIAQELEEKHPEFVRTDDEGMKSVAYIDLLITKIAELEARLEKAGI